MKDQPVSARKAATRRPAAILLAMTFLAGAVSPVRAASPCDGATHPGQCAWLGAASLPPYVQDAILAKGGVIGAGSALVLSSGDPLDPDNEISNDVGLDGCGTNPDGWQTWDCTLMHDFVPPEDSVVLALSSEWFEWYQSIFTDWMTISGAGVATVDVSINSWIDQKVDVIPYGPWETGVVLLTSLSAQKMVDFRVSDSGDHIYDTAIVVVPASWFSGEDVSGNDPTLLCGDGQLEPGEECDDGNLVADDDCSNLCLGVQPPPSSPPPAATCGNLVYAWPSGATAPYTCGNDLCGGFRCVAGNTISPACYTAAQCAAACGGSCVDVQAASLDCSTMCALQPPATEPPPAVAPPCGDLAYAWPDGTTMPYTCDDDCQGQRCVSGNTVSPECYQAGECDAACDGACIDTPPGDCEAFCAAAEAPATCLPSEVGQTRPAAAQSGPCQGNLEVCKDTLEWRLADDAFVPEDEACNSIDDDCNGAVDDMFVTCGDTGLCLNTVNTCDSAHPDVPVACVPLPAPSPVEICGNGLDDDCEGAVDDGCECGDEECMPGEDWAACPADCPQPANGTPCDDANPCTTGESWQAGTCSGGAEVTCGEDNACVVAGTCDPATGCVAVKVDCNDSIDCTLDTCDPVTGCANTPDDGACNDGDPCSVDTCDVALGCTWAPDPACLGQDADGDGFVAATDGGDDCDDASAAVHPGAAEACNGVDDDCDAAADEAWPGLGATCYGEANACGVTDAGLVACTPDGTAAACNAATPPDPAGLGDACSSPANACGETAAGTIGCDGSCGAVVPVATDGDGDGAVDCLDGCPADAAKTAPGACGCGASDADTNGNGVADCLETTRADLGVTAELRTRTPVAARPVRVKLDVTNAGPDRVVPGATVAGSIVGGAVTDLRLPRQCTGTAEAFMCETAELAAGRHKSLKVQAVPVGTSVLVFQFSVSGPLVDPAPGNQAASVEVVVP